MAGQRQRAHPGLTKLSVLVRWLVHLRIVTGQTQLFAGAQKLAFNGLTQPGWKRYFVKILGSEILEEESTSSPQFTVPADSRLEIVVEDSVVRKIKLTLKHEIVRRCQPPPTSSGSDAMTASAAFPSGTDLHAE